MWSSAMRSHFNRFVDDPIRNSPLVSRGSPRAFRGGAKRCFGPSFQVLVFPSRMRVRRGGAGSQQFAGGRFSAQVVENLRVELVQIGGDTATVTARNTLSPEKPAEHVEFSIFFPDELVKVTSTGRLASLLTNRRRRLVRRRFPMGDAGNYRGRHDEGQGVGGGTLLSRRLVVCPQAQAKQRPARRLDHRSPAPFLNALEWSRFLEFRKSTHSVMSPSERKCKSAYRERSLKFLGQRL